MASIALLLEDEPLISMDIEMSLEAGGFDVVTVMSCAEANAWLDRQKPDIVIVDIELQDGKCTEVVTRLLAAKIPFFIHSGDHPSQYKGTPFALGTWVGKPSDATQLLAAASQAIDLAHSEA